MSNKSIIAVALGTALISPLAQGNAGTGRTSAGFGAPRGSAGSGIRGNGWTATRSSDEHWKNRKRQFEPGRKNRI
jgi:hypothetical protein